MDLKEQAKQFILDIQRNNIISFYPSIISPEIATGKILEGAGYSDIVVAAGYLHTVFSRYRQQKNTIEILFGEEIVKIISADIDLSSLPLDSKEISKLSKLTFEQKLILCANKIHFLESTINQLEANTINFLRPQEIESCALQHYISMLYKNLTDEKIKNEPIFKRLEKDIIAFNNIPDNKFCKDQNYLVIENYKNEDYENENKQIGNEVGQNNNKKLAKVYELTKHFPERFNKKS